MQEALVLERNKVPFPIVYSGTVSRGAATQVRELQKRLEKEGATAMRVQALESP